MHSYVLKLLLAFLLACCTLSSHSAPRRGVAAPVRVVGVVADSISGERLPFVNVWSKEFKKGVTTDNNGVFELRLPEGAQIEVSSLGYAPVKRRVSARDTLRVFMTPGAVELQEVIVKPKRQKYSKKNNPAVELMRRVRRDASLHDPGAKSPYYSYDRYDKMVIAINDYKGYLPGKDGKVKGKFKGLLQLVDTGIWTGKRILDVSMKEKLSTRIRTSAGMDKEVVTAQRAQGIDRGLDAGYTRAFFEDVLREVDVYANDIPVLRNRFVSPLSAIGADFYMYHIEDTVQIGDQRCVELSFAPHNPESMGFNGKLYIPADDSVKYVKRVVMRLPKAANVNFVESFLLSQTYEKDSLGLVHKKLDDMVLELHIAGAFGEMYTARQSRYDNRSYEQRRDLEEYYNKIGQAFVIDEADSRSDEFWPTVRMLPLSAAEKQLSVQESPFRKFPFIYWTTRAVELIIKGYVKTSGKSKFDFGPIDTFISHNAAEGLRLGVGGLTTANLSPNIFARAYVAYGFKDHKWKYSGELEYSFDKKKYHSREFAVNSIKATYRYDVNNIGQHYLTNSANNLLNSIKRLDSNLMTYERYAALEYKKEWHNNLSITTGIYWRNQESSPYVPFINADGTSSTGYRQGSFKFEIRYAPGEKFIQTYNERLNINRDALTLMLSHEIGPKGILGSQFFLNKTEFLLQKRFWFSAFGYTDIIFRAGKLWNQVQFPALLWQNANVAYTMQSETFSLLNPMEFAMDQYVGLDFTYNFNGLLFNRIPLIKKLRLREVFTFKGFAGSLTRKNNPAFNDGLYRFPADAHTRPMGDTPYMEIGAGIDNICKFMRLDYVWRLTYRDTPGAPNHGLRFSFHFDF